MIDFTQEEIAIIEANVNSISKSTMIAIYAIYDTYNGTSNVGCWCGASARKAKHKTFYAWYNENKIIDDEQTTN